MSVLADLVSVNVTSTGTGTLTLGSAIAGYRPFSVLPDGSVVTYGLTNGSQFELGVGTIGGGGTTLTRSLRSSSTGSLLVVTSGASVSIVPASFDIPPQVNMAATTDPAGSDDASQGYAVGSFWFRASTGQLWICRSATTGSAVWIPMAGIGIGKQTIFVPASAMTPRVSAGAGVGSLETAVNKINLTTLDFDPSIQEHAQFSIAMPTSWNEGQISYEVLWYHPATTTNFGVTWAMEAVSLSDGNALDTSFGSQALVTDTGGTTNTLYDSPESALFTVGNVPAENDTVVFQIYRVPSDTNDTMAADARLIGVRVFYTTNTNSDVAVLPFRLPPRSGQYFGERSETGSGAIFIDGTILYVPILVPVNTTIDRLALPMQSGGASMFAKCSLFEVAADRSPGSKIVDCASPIALDGYGLKFGTFSANPALAAGLYWAGILPNSSTPQPKVAANWASFWAQHSIHDFTQFWSESNVAFYQNTTYAAGLPAVATPVLQIGWNTPVALLRAV